MTLLDSVRRTIRRHDLASSHTRVVAALSGGSDSIALLHILGELDAAGELSLAGIAHFNHQLRDAADRDETFCRSAAEAAGVPFFAGRDDVRARARRERRSIEDAARTSRHEFFDLARAQFSADVVALGHTRDDQAETFLLRLLRGAGPRGLAAMHPKNGRIVRPLLECRRADFRRYLRARGIDFLEDETNADVAVPRNRVRAELLPLLQDRFNPSVVEVLARQAELARDDWMWMIEEVRSQKLNVGSIAELRAAPRALRRFALWRAMTEAARAKPVAFEHVEAVLDMLDSGRASWIVDAPGHVVERIGDRLVLREGRSDEAEKRRAASGFRYPLSIPGEVRLPDYGCVVSAELASAGSALGASSAKVRNRTTAVVAGGWAAPLAVRNRRPGDRFRPFGRAGRKKLQDFLVDRKVARADRDRVPLVVDENDRIVWVAGHEIDEAFRVTEAAQAVLILTLRQVE